MQNSSWGLGGRPLRVAASFNPQVKQLSQRLMRQRHGSIAEQQAQ